MKDEFISIAAHELRTPLTVLLGYTELLQMETTDQLEPELKRECFENIHVQGMSLERIIDDLLDVGRIASGRSLPIDRSYIQFSDFLVKFCNNYKRETTRHSIQVELPAHDLCLSADPGRLSQILENLLSNAIKFSPAEGVIRIKAGIEGESLFVSISDTGIGMTEQQRQRMFDKFYRADTSNTAVRGLGLGMDIVKNIVEAHGGSIWVKSAFQKGTTVSFTIPLAAS